MMAKSQWLWIDGEYYYFYSDGAMACNAVTPGGYNVDKTGAWIK
jgi:glucan-binding YG repeat protein